MIFFFLSFQSRAPALPAGSSAVLPPRMVPAWCLPGLPARLCCPWAVTSGPGTSEGTLGHTALCTPRPTQPTPPVQHTLRSVHRSSCGMHWGGIICNLVGDKRPRCPGRGSCTGSCRHSMRGGRRRLLGARSELVSAPPLTCARGWPACGRSGCGCWGSPAPPGSCKAKAGQERLGAAGMASVLLRGWGRRGTHRDCSWGRLSNCPGKISFKGL